MTVVAFASVKGAPGVTTLACLVGATWPGRRPAVVVEADPCGGDLAPRFELSARIGWPSFLAGGRRVGSAVSVAPHLQQLPGGLDVLVGPGGEGEHSAAGIEWLVAGTGAAASPAPTVPTASTETVPGDRTSWDLIVDLGRLLPSEPQSTVWATHARWLVVVLRSDPASVWAVRRWTSSLRAQWGERVGLAVVTGAGYAATEIASFTGLPLLVEVPSDQAAASAVCGGRGSGRRLFRSPLVGSASALAQRLAGPIEPLGDPADLRSSELVARGHLGLLRRHLHRSFPVAPESPVGPGDLELPVEGATGPESAAPSLLSDAPPKTTDNRQVAL